MGDELRRKNTMSEQSKSRFILVFLREEGTGITSFGLKSKGVEYSGIDSESPSGGGCYSSGYPQ